jgi:fructose-1,6-bisphosphatase/inositol monophosphatase family enzyme
LPDTQAVLALIDASIEQAGNAEHRAWEKSTGEWVTELDLVIEAALTESLSSLLSGSRVLAEEAASQDSSWLNWIAQGQVWIVDPLDGTANYVTGSGPVATMAALVVDGSPQLSCIRLHGGPALLADATGVRVIGGKASVEHHRERGRGVISARFLPRRIVDQMSTALVNEFDIVDGSGCAGSDYVDLVCGRLDFLIYERVLPWDHVPGAYAVTKMGGSVQMGDGSSYRAQPEGAGLVASSSRQRTSRLLELRRAAINTGS